MKENVNGQKDQKDAEIKKDSHEQKSTKAADRNVQIDEDLQREVEVHERKSPGPLEATDKERK